MNKEKIILGTLVLATGMMIIGNAFILFDAGIQGLSWINVAITGLAVFLTASAYLKYNG